ncbi:MAG: TIGR03809 family protein [Xanthobacteraceae bacterium]|jgi:uncharacterized repeat protein (TIGR03809 family)
MALMAHWHSTPALDEVAQKWRALAERRRAHFVELYHTGRWKRYYSEEQFLLKMREAIKATDRWAQIAPTPPRTGASEPSRVQAATPKRSAA